MPSCWRVCRATRLAPSSLMSARVSLPEPLRGCSRTLEVKSRRASSRATLEPMDWARPRRVESAASISEMRAVDHRVEREVAGRGDGQARGGQVEALDHQLADGVGREGDLQLRGRAVDQVGALVAGIVGQVGDLAQDLVELDLDGGQLVAGRGLGADRQALDLADQGVDGFDRAQGGRDGGDRLVDAALPLVQVQGTVVRALASKKAVASSMGEATFSPVARRSWVRLIRLWVVSRASRLVLTADERAISLAIFLSPFLLRPPPTGAASAGTRAMAVPEIYTK